MPGVDGAASVLEGVSVWGLESVLGERSETAESSEVRASFPKDLSPVWVFRGTVCNGRAGEQKKRRVN